MATRKEVQTFWVEITGLNQREFEEDIGLVSSGNFLFSRQIGQPAGIVGGLIDNVIKYSSNK